MSVSGALLNLVRSGRWRCAVFSSDLKIHVQHYLLVNQDEARIEHYRRNADNPWTLSNAEVGGVVRLPDLGGDRFVDDLYPAIEVTRS